MNQEQYQIYSDESGQEQYRSIGALSGKKILLDKLKSDLQTILASNQLTSIEFKDIKGDSRRRKAAIGFIEKGILF